MVGLETMAVMSAPRVCPSCSEWLCGEADAFCGACGRSCARVSLEAIPSVLPLGHVPPRVGLRVVNPTCASMRITQVISPEWLEVAMPASIDVKPGTSAMLMARARTFSLRQPESSEVEVQTSLGGVRVLMMVIQDPPALAMSSPAIQYWPDRAGTARLHDIDIHPLSGHLRARRLIDPVESWARLRTDLPEPIVIGRDKPLRVSLQLDPDRMPPLRAGLTRTLRTRIGLEYDGPHGPGQAAVDIDIEVRRPPELTWTGEHAPPRVRWRSVGQTIGFTFANAVDTDTFGGRQNGHLEIVDVSLRAPDGKASAIQRRSPLPVTMAGGESQWVEFVADCTSLDAAIHYFTLSVTTNRAELNRALRVPIEIRDVEPFDGIVAIDFGTSNSCCALLPEGGEAELVALDEQRQTAPTIVRYLDLSGPTPLIETGTSVKLLAAVDEKVAGGTVTRLKQQLGESTHPITVRPKNSADWVMREVREAAADYLHHVRTVAEQQRGATFHEFVLTHPAVCSLQQYRNLRYAVERAFGANARVHFLAEPIASLVPFFDRRSQNGGPSQYTVAAFDLGGGTTDITLVHVSHATTPSATLEIRPEIVASWGERFGGEDLTDFLVAELKNRCRQIVATERPGYRIAERSVRGASTPSIRRNESALRVWADAFKASLSDEAGRVEPADRIVLSLVPEALDQMPDEHTFAVDELRETGEDLEQLFVHFLREQVGRLADRLQRSAGERPPDFIQLSGKTALLGEVGRLIQQRFTSASIERAAEPKECVVRGACLWRTLSRGQRRRLVLPTGLQRTTSQIGFMNEDQVFVSLIPLDEPIPPEGLTREVPSGWNSDTPLVLWENLGVDDQRVAEDGSRNPLISRLGIWETRAPGRGDQQWWTLRLTLLPTFVLRISAVSPSNDVIELRMRPSSRLGS